MKKEFSSLETILIITIFFLVPILIFSAGIIVLFQTNFSKEGILMSILPFTLGISSFFALNLHQVIIEIFKKNKKEEK